MRRIVIIAGLACALAACSSGSSKSDALIGVAMEKVFRGITGDDELIDQANETAFLDAVRELVDYSSSQRDPEVPEPGQDIRLFGVTGRWMSQAELAQFESNFPEGQGSIGTTFYASQQSLEPDWYLFGYAEFVGDVPINDCTKILQYGMVWDRDGDPANNWQGQDPFDLDFFNGTDKWLQLVKAANETARLFMSDVDGTDVQEVISRARAIVCENAIVYAVPMSEFPERNFYPSYRVSSFWNITGDFGFNSGEWSGDTAPAERSFDALAKLDWSVTARLAPQVQYDVWYGGTTKDVETELDLSLGLSWNLDLAGDFGEGGVVNGHMQDHAFDWDAVGGGFNGHSLIPQDLQAGWLAPEVFDPANFNDKFSVYIRTPGDTGIEFNTDPADRNTVSGVTFDGSIPYLSGTSTLKGQIRGSILSEQDFSMKLPELESDPGVNLFQAPSVFSYGGQTVVIQHRNRTSAIDNFTTSVRATAESADNQLQMGDTGVTVILTPTFVNDRIDLKLRVGVGGTFRATQDIQVNGATMGVHLPVIEARDLEAGISLNHGETLVLGGFQPDGAMTVQQGVPFLRDIPILGKQFATPRDIDDSEKVFILVRARLVNYTE